MTGYESKKAAAQAKVVVTDLDGHVVGTVRKPKKAAAIAKTIDKVNWLDHEPNGLTAAAFIAAEESKVKARYGYVPKLHPNEYMQEQPVQEPDWKALVLEHNADCNSRCDMDACGYKGHFEFSNRRCPTCPVKQKIDVNYATQPTQEPVAWMQSDEVHISLWKDDYHTIPLYTAPPQRPWVGLTDEEMESIFLQCRGEWNGDYWKIEDADLHPFLRTIETKLKEKNT